LKKIGILAIQGDFDKHKQFVQELGYDGKDIRTSEQLAATDALIVPGGESTTFMRLLHEFNLIEAIQKYAAEKPVFGTCAGCIILASAVDHLPYPPLALIDIHIKRNAYGRQRESFIDDIVLNLPEYQGRYAGVFIRAPKIIKVGNTIKVLARHGEDPVMVSSNGILVCTFHPELTMDRVIHSYFLKNFVK
jgi:5'-phosphate synthase pdxT subunit